MKTAPKENQLYLIVGPSGTGKTTLMRRLVAEGLVHEIKSSTTRARRAGEPEDTYRFMSEEEFKRLEADNQFVESVVFGGNHYGIQKKDIVDPMFFGSKPCAVIVDGHGMSIITDLFPFSSHVFFLEPADDEEMNKRLANRPRDEKRIASDLEIMQAKKSLLVGVDRVQPPADEDNVFRNFLDWMNRK